jgi:hypothetical protein
MKNLNIISLISNNLYLNEISRLKHTLKSKPLLFTLQKTESRLKEAFKLDFKSKTNSTEALVVYKYSRESYKHKMEFKQCFLSSAVINSTTIALGCYFDFKIFSYDFKKDKFNLLIDVDNDSYNAYDCDYFYEYSGEAVKERTGCVAKIEISGNRLIAQDGLHGTIYICDMKGSILKTIEGDAINMVIGNLNGYYNEGIIQFFDRQETLRIKVANKKLVEYDVYCFGSDKLVFKSKSRVYIYHIDYANGTFNKVYKKDFQSSITTGVFGYLDNRCLFGTIKGVMKLLSLTDPHYKQSIRYHCHEMTKIAYSQDKLIISADIMGLIKLTDYYTLHLRSTIMTGQAVHLVISPDINKLTSISLYKEDINAEYVDEYEGDNFDHSDELKMEYDNRSTLTTFDLREKDVCTTLYPHTGPLVDLISIGINKFVSTDMEFIYIWKGTQLAYKIKQDMTIKGLKDSDTDGFYLDIYGGLVKVRLFDQVCLIEVKGGFVIHDLELDKKIGIIQFGKVDEAQAVKDFVVFKLRHSLMIFDIKTHEIKTVVSVGGKDLKILRKKGSDVAFWNGGREHMLNVNTLSITSIK